MVSNFLTLNDNTRQSDKQLAHCCSDVGSRQPSEEYTTPLYLAVTLILFTTCACDTCGIGKD